MSVGYILKLIRTAQNIQQVEMAEKLGVSSNFLSQVENDKKTVSLATMESFAKKLGVSKEFLLISSSEAPNELSPKKKEYFSKMKNEMISYILEKSK